MAREPVLMTTFLPRNVRVPAIGKLDFKGLWTHEIPSAHDQFRAALLVIVEMNIDEVLNHLALAFTDRCHIDVNILFADAELLAAIKQRGDLGAVDDVLARQASDVRARAAHIFALDYDHVLSLLGRGPGDELSAGTAAQDD